jgi:TolB protein
MLTAQDRPENPPQIWEISYPDGQAHQVTNDVNKYQNLSMNADSSVLVTRKVDTFADVWVASGGGADPARQITSRQGKNLSVCWTPDGRLVYSSLRNNNSDLWIMNSDGTDQKQLTVGAGYNVSPAVTGDGRYILFESLRSGATNIWRTDLDGTNPIQLTRGNNDRNPQPSPDGGWVVYESRDAAIPTLWRVPIDGGTAAQLVEKRSWQPAISPDGKLIAFSYQDEPKSALRFAVIPTDGSAPIKLLANASNASHIRWSPDGSALTYAYFDGAGVVDIWSLPVNGSPPRRVTHFDSGGINSFSWSPDGKQIAVVRISDFDEVVVIRNFR